MTYVPKHELRADAEAGDPSVRLSAVTKSYQTGEVAVLALRGLNLTVPQGQFVVILGPSGSGKTTLMNVIGGIENPSTGEVIVAGADLTGSDDASLTEYRRQQVGFVFQFFNLIPTLTAFENVALVAELVGLGESEAQAALAEVGLADRADHFPSALSGGEQQRVAIARALVKRPAVLLADEPTGSLDLETGRQVLAALRRAADDTGCTVLLVTHNRAIADMADRVLHLGSGELEGDVTNPHPVAASEVSW
ncbi:MAG TPA: ABC transporter ATP-binding protein [Propionicimonas sp.]|nr:ABC transporter ATP-binding protein [Propionicimonas sp.]